MSDSNTASGYPGYAENTGTTGSTYDQAAWDAYNTYYQYYADQSASNAVAATSTGPEHLSANTAATQGQKRQADYAFASSDPATTSVLDHIPLPPSGQSLATSSDVKRQKMFATPSTTTYDGLSMVAAAYASAKNNTYSAQPTTYDTSSSTYSQAAPTGYSQPPVTYAQPPTRYSQSSSNAATYGSSSIVGYPQTYAQAPVAYSESATVYSSQAYSQDPSNTFESLGDYYFENPYLCGDSEDEDDYGQQDAGGYGHDRHYGQQFDNDQWNQYGYSRQYQRTPFRNRQRQYRDNDQPLRDMERRTRQLLNQRYNDELTDEDTRIIIQQLKETTDFTKAEYSSLGFDLSAAFKEYTRRNRRSPSAENEWWHVTKHLELTCEYVMHKIQRDVYGTSHPYGAEPDQRFNTGPRRDRRFLSGSGGSHTGGITTTLMNMAMDKVPPLMDGLSSERRRSWERDAPKRRLSKKQLRCLHDLQCVLPRMLDPHDAQSVKLGLVMGLFYTFKSKFPLKFEETKMIEDGISEIRVLLKDDESGDVQVVISTVQKICDIMGRFLSPEDRLKTQLFSKGIAQSMMATFRSVMSAFRHATSGMHAQMLEEEQRLPDDETAVKVPGESRDPEDELKTDGEGKEGAARHASTSSAHDIVDEDGEDASRDVTTGRDAGAPEDDTATPSADGTVEKIDGAKHFEEEGVASDALPSINTFSLGITYIPPPEPQVFATPGGAQFKFGFHRDSDSSEEEHETTSQNDQQATQEKDGDDVVQKNGDFSLVKSEAKPEPPAADELEASEHQTNGQSAEMTSAVVPSSPENPAHSEGDSVEEMATEKLADDLDVKKPVVEGPSEDAITV